MCISGTPTPAELPRIKPRARSLTNRPHVPKRSAVRYRNRHRSATPQTTGTDRAAVNRRLRPSGRHTPWCESPAGGDVRKVEWPRTILASLLPLLPAWLARLDLQKPRAAPPNSGATSSGSGGSNSPDCRPSTRESVELIGNDGNCH